MRTIHEAAAALAEGRTTARQLVEECLARIADPPGAGAPTFIKVHATQARATDPAAGAGFPAAMCGGVGYNPPARRIPIDGVLPLAPSLDSVGPLANTVACCATIDAVLAGEPLPNLQPFPLAGLRLAVPT